MVPFTLLEVSYFCLQSQKAGWIVKPTQYIPSCSVVEPKRHGTNVFNQTLRK